MAGTHEGRVAAVTGAAQGIGQAICRGLAARGAAVIGLDLNEPEETGRILAEMGAPFLGFAGDAAAPEVAERVAAEASARFGRCDILVNNAGIFGGTPWDTLGYDTWRHYFRTNVDSQFLMAKALAPMMRTRGWGRIVNVTSDSVAIPFGGSTAYKASKMAVIGFTRGLAGDLADFGITVNAVSPSLTRTPGVMERIGEERLKAMAARQLIKKVAEPDDVVGLVLFLTGEDSYFVTGQTIFSDGGLAVI